MCLTCGKHIWWSEKDPLPPSGLQLLIAKNLRQVIIAGGMKLVENRQPYGNKAYGKVPVAIINEATRLIHGMQVIPSFDTTASILQGAEKAAITYCDCIYYLGSPDGSHKKGEKIVRCIALGYMADEEIREGRAEEINYEEALEIVRLWRNRGAIQTAGWILGKPGHRPVSWICSCDINCGQHRMPEARGVLPSYVVANLNEELCISCGECEHWCPFNRGLHYDHDRGLPVIDTENCKGCGLCVENCPTKAINYKVRLFGWDPRTGKQVRYTDFIDEDELKKL